MNSLVGNLVLQVMPAVVLSVFAVYVAYIVLSPERLKSKLAKHTNKAEGLIDHKLYNKDFLLGLVCYSLFFFMNIVNDLHKAPDRDDSFLVFLALIIDIGLIITGSVFISKALRRK